MTDFDFARARRARGLPPHTPDPAQVQGRVHAYLVARGQHLAHDPGLDLDLDQAEDDLVRLAELDAMAEHPTLAPGLATLLNTIVSERDHQSVHTPQDLDRLQTLGLYLGPTPERDRKPEGPRSTAPEREDATGEGQDGTVSRRVRIPADKRNILDEAMDDVQFPEEGE